MCIADGVGGWARSGGGQADAGRWSRLLTHFCEVEVTQWWAGKEEYAAASVDAASSDAGSSAREESGSGGWASKAWKSITDKSTDKSNAEEVKRRPLDPVEIMQRGYEKCLSCVLQEVSEINYLN